jgi:predicted ATPase
MLTICLHSPFQIVAIEEPEIHLHPSMVRNLAHAMIDIAANEDRNLIVSTHSEAFVVALLSQIAAGKVDVDKVSFYLAENRGGETILTKCAATADGQIEGGLEAFMAMEAEDLVNFLGLGR